MKTSKSNDLGERILVEDCKKIRIENIARQAKRSVTHALIRSFAEVDGFDIELTSKPLFHNGQRLWFVCGICRQAVGVLYKHPFRGVIGCRKCLFLEYRCRRYKGMIESKES